MAWNTIESDPAVFTELLEAAGVKGLQLEELYDLGDESIPADVFGLFFLFKWQKGRSEAPPDADGADGPIFLQQVIPNACGTIALLHVLLNCPGLDIGDVLTNFRDFVRFLPPEDRGTALASCDPIRIAHNSFARPEPFVSDEREAGDDDDAFHFVAYTAIGESVYEFDGLQAGPKLLGKTTPGERWVAVARQHLQERIHEYSASEIRFNLLALTKSRLAAAQDGVVRLLGRLRSVYDALDAAAATGDAAPPEAIAVGAGLDPQLVPESCALLPRASDPAGLQAEYAELQGALGSACGALESEKAQRTQWRLENERRRHNFVPLIMEMLTQLATRGKLMPLLSDGLQRASVARSKEFARRVEARRAQAAEKKDARG